MVTKNTTALHDFFMRECGRLHRELIAAENRSSNMLNTSRDKSEAVTDRIERERQKVLAQQLAEQLAVMVRAKEKVEEGTYGICDSCAKPIPTARLKVLPQALTCIDCKGKTEKRDIRTAY